MKQSLIHIKDQIEGFHYYPNAPNEVAFLRFRHRHLFKADVWIEVFKKDRELEFFTVKENVKRALAGLWTKTDNPGSCETMADSVLESLKKVYGDRRRYIVEISEDGENGGICQYIPPNYAQPYPITVTITDPTVMTNPAPDFKEFIRTIK